MLWILALSYVAFGWFAIYRLVQANGRFDDVAPFENIPKAGPAEPAPISGVRWIGDGEDVEADDFAANELVRNQIAS